MKLKEQYKKITEKYIKKFCKLTGFSRFEIIDEIGSNYDFNEEYPFHFSDIVEIVDYRYSKESVLEWHDFFLMTKTGLSYPFMYQSMKSIST